MASRPLQSATLLFVAILVATLAATARPARAQGPLPPAATVHTQLPAAPRRPEAGVRWQSLTPAQRDALGPLEREWPTIDAARKQKWLAIAGRFNALPPQERARISERMTEWVRLTPSERGEARLRYQEARQVPAPDRSARWEAYQKLPPGEKQQFAARAASSTAAAAVAPSRREAIGRDTTQAKANLVPNPALALPPRPVAPTVVQASRGATTHLITRPTAPPAHQQTGMPKIAATPEFVNRSTLLPRRGPQAAAVTPVSALTKPSVATPPAPRPAPVAVRTSEPGPPR
jgi:hypothetical protein